MRVQVRDPKTYRFLAEWDDDDRSCNPWAGSDYAGHCGGCPDCMEAQAYYAGLLVIRPDDLKGRKWFRWLVRNGIERGWNRTKYFLWLYFSKNGRSYRRYEREKCRK